MLKEFKEFINKGNVLMVAVAFIVGLYFKTIVDEVLAGVILPIIAAIFGEPDYSNIGFTINGAEFSIGKVINALISFIVVSFVLFLIVKAYNRFQKSPEAGPTEIELLTEIRDALTNR